MKNAVIYIVLAAGAGVLLYTLFRRKPEAAGSPTEGTADSKINDILNDPTTGESRDISQPIYVRQNQGGLNDPKVTAWLLKKYNDKNAAAIVALVARIKTERASSPSKYPYNPEWKTLGMSDLATAMYMYGLEKATKARRERGLTDQTFWSGKIKDELKALQS
jgi:hypothetical protein